jgi:DNA-binding transcriptional MerR regulator
VKEISIGEFARRSRLSLKALRLYDERGVLVPSRVDQASGYRYYDTAQLEAARLVVMLRQLQLPLAAIKELLACDPADAAARIAEHWRGAEAAHDARRDLADYLVNRPEDLGLRITYFATGPVTATSVPDDYCDLALPFAVER